jgi:hypothetical protein
MIWVVLDCIVAGFLSGSAARFIPSSVASMATLSAPILFFFTAQLKSGQRSQRMMLELHIRMVLTGALAYMPL